MRSSFLGAVAIGLFVSACAADPASPPEYPPPPPPPAAAPPGEVLPASADVQSADAPPTAPPSQAANAQGPLPPMPTQAPQYTPTADAAPPPATEWTTVYPTGQWVYATDYGWMWIPNDASLVAHEGVPYAYLYTPRYGWTWYVSPWGGGPYRYGVWVRHPWRPVGWRYGWAARPAVVVHIGGGYRGGYYRGGYRGGRGGGHRR